MTYKLLFRLRLIAAFILLCTASVYAQRLDSAAVKEQLRQAYIDSFDKSLNYQTGKIAIKDIATLNVPDGYKFIPADKSEMIVHDLWGNPKSNGILGMIVKTGFKISNTDEWAFVVSYDESGFVKDEDADKIDYDELLKKIKEDETEENKERVKEGYPPVYMQGWAAKPYYDKEHKVLHWAKTLKFGDAEPSIALNYDVRILGRKGILSLNAVGTTDQLADINTHIPDVLKMATFTDGNKYKDFNPSMDKVAAYTIGGLIAGKLIAKTGLIVLLLKNIKLIMLAVFGGFATFRKKLGNLFSRKKKEEPAKAPVVLPWDVTAETTEVDAAPQDHITADADTQTNHNME